MKKAVALAVFVLATPLAGAPAPPGGLLLVANKGDHTLGLVDPDAGAQIATVAESGVTAHELTASPDGRLAYVPVYGDSGVGRPGSDGRTIDVVDLASHARVATIDLGRPERPHAAHFGRDGRLYVTTELTRTITVVDPRTNAVVDRIPTGQAESHMLVLSRDGRRAWTSNVGPGTVSAIDLAAKKVAAVIPVAKTAQRIALSVDERHVFTSDQDAPRLAVVSTARNAVERWVSLPGKGYGAAPTPDGRFLLVAITTTNQVAVVDLKEWTVARTIDVPRVPQEVLVRPDGRVAYVSCDASRKVAAIDLGTWKVDRLIDAGPGVDGLAWAPAAK
jgi:DNA-binding beta-propeller fold protein YncE